MMKRSISWRAALAACLLAAADPAAARGQSVFRGTVAGIKAEKLLRGARVDIDSLNLHVRTDAHGAFVLPGIPAGTHAVSVRHDGFAILDTALAFSGQDTVAARFILASAMDTLDPVELKMADFEKRRARGMGWFLVRADLDRMYDRTVSEVLSRRIPGIQLIRNSRGNGVAVASGRGIGSERELTSGDGFPPACYAQLWVDGARVFSTGQGRTPVDINEWRVSDIEGIEYYPAMQQTPPEYVGVGALCGTIGIWLRVD